MSWGRPGRKLQKTTNSVQIVAINKVVQYNLNTGKYNKQRGHINWHS